MSPTFESEKNRKAFLYTAAIIVALLLIAIFFTWQILPPPVPVTQDLIEINLGNFDEGFGPIQPLIKGTKAADNLPQPSPTTISNPTPAKDLQPDDNADADAAPIEKSATKTQHTTPTPPIIKPTKNTHPNPAVPPTPKPQKPKIAGYGGPQSGKGNGATEDNGYTYQGNKNGGKGDAGNPNGKPDSYGNNAGGKTGGSGLRVSKGDRTILNNYIFIADLPKATINAIIQVSAEGTGTFVSFDKGSTNTDYRYVAAIKSYLPNIQFNKSNHQSIVTVPFNFKVQ